MTDSVDARLLGELAVVVIRAQHLSDRSKIGKHHPYVVLKYGNTKTKTPVVKKGGQHPTFDAEVRFKITEDAEDIVDRPEINDGDSTKAKKGRRIPKNKSMVVTVFADDPKEPKLVGETVVDLTVVFEKCEHDDMFELKYKDMFAGEIYLEMTYFINDAPPIPRKVPKPVSWMDYGTTGPLPPGVLRFKVLLDMVAWNRGRMNQFLIPPVQQRRHRISLQDEVVIRHRPVLTIKAVYNLGHTFLRRHSPVGTPHEIPRSARRARRMAPLPLGHLQQFLLASCHLLGGQPQRTRIPIGIL
ncbi:hypothetical protein QFC21_000316 [Naganishia friedmannii]|uniref:Uncharacterized protein n=1 Tax=Naganishia friedmannii TaxID=89922 RepID=A0ACC2WD61_9TREE|nr:hypothetical protein QFC21_000316 [Naganishia friedmannii]